MDEVNDNSCRRCNPKCPKNCEDSLREAWAWKQEEHDLRNDGWSEHNVQNLPESLGLPPHPGRGRVPRCDEAAAPGPLVTGVLGLTKLVER